MTQQRTTDDWVRAIAAGEFSVETLPDQLLTDLIDVLKARQNPVYPDACANLFCQATAQHLKSGQVQEARAFADDLGVDLSGYSNQHLLTAVVGRRSLYRKR